MNCDEEPLNIKGTQTWALSTETRNVDDETAYHQVKEAAQMFVEKLKPDYYYKKIDSTIRGNIAIEVLALLEVLEWDASITVSYTHLDVYKRQGKRQADGRNIPGTGQNGRRHR